LGRFLYLIPTLNVSDFVHPERSIETARRFAEALERHGARGNVDFTAITAEVFAERAPALLRAIRAQGLSIGFHGANRPLTSTDRVRDLGWDDAVREITAMDTHRIDPETGRVDPERPGGFLTLERFAGGPPLSVGRVVHPAYLEAHKRLGARMLVGLTDHVGAESNLAWYMGMLSRPDRVFLTPGAIMAPATPRGPRAPPHPVEVLRSLEASLPRTRPVFISTTMHETDFYMAGRWTDPGSPLKPAEATEAIWRVWEETIAYAAEGGAFRTASYRDVIEMVVDDRERTLSRGEVGRAADCLVDRMSDWTGHGRVAHTPDYIDLGGDYLSLADAFQALAQSLAHYAAAGTLPDTVHVRDIHGPIDTPPPPREAGPPQRGYGPLRLVEGEKVLEAASGIASDPILKVPAAIQVDGLPREINPAEFLYLAAQEYRMIEARGKPAPVIFVQASVLPRQGLRGAAGPVAERQRWYALLQLWTYKPARLKPP